ncbi:hypothetical protein JW905_09180 [bacterium]|nr:hypothetical protein [candidate division CSSED10-310 bacterium]
MGKPEVKIGEWIQEGFNLYKANFGVLVVASLIAILLGSLTIGILAGPLMVGMILMTLAIYDRKEPKPQIGDVFGGFKYFLNAFLFYLVWGLIFLVISAILAFIPCLGQLLTIVVVLGGGAFLMFGPFLIADRNMDFWPASMKSIEMVKSDIWPFIGLYVLASIIGGLGAILCGIGMILTLPITFCILAIAYRHVFDGAVSIPVPPPFPMPPASESPEPVDEEDDPHMESL